MWRHGPKGEDNERRRSFPSRSGNRSWSKSGPYPKRTATSDLVLDSKLLDNLQRVLLESGWPEDLAKQAVRLRFWKGNPAIVIQKHVIDCDEDPPDQKGMSVYEHRKGGKLAWNADDVTLYLSEKLQGNRHTRIHGYDLYKELQNKPVLNGVVFEYLWRNQHLIPDSWKDGYVLFWGTIYRSSCGQLWVPALTWRRPVWTRRFIWLHYPKCSRYKAAMLKS